MSQEPANAEEEEPMLEYELKTENKSCQYSQPALQDSQQQQQDETHPNKKEWSEPDENFKQYNAASAIRSYYEPHVEEQIKLMANGKRYYKERYHRMKDLMRDIRKQTGRCKRWSSSEDSEDSD